MKLEGDAFFRVQKGRTFVVSTQNGQILVLGTSFNVIAREEQLIVYCQTGKVKVSHKGSAMYLLNPGMKVDCEKNVLCSSDEEKELSWKTGEFWYRDTPFDQVLEEIERQFDIRIKNKCKDKYYTGYFRNTDIQEALNLVLLPLGLKYKQMKNEYEILVSN